MKDYNYSIAKKIKTIIKYIGKITQSFNYFAYLHDCYFVEIKLYPADLGEFCFLILDVQINSKFLTKN